MSKIIAITLLGVSLLSLSGCAVMGGDFDCQKVGGIKGCVSLNDVNKMTQNGTLSSDASEKTQTEPLLKNGFTAYANQIPTIGQPVRFGDQIQQVTIFPYKDNIGNYHEASIVYAILKASHWVDYPVSEIQSDTGGI
jgi:conjugal transfer pilus assembly protein TraV